MNDVSSIISHLELNYVTLVGWSYSSLVVFYYLEEYGVDKIRAVNIAVRLSAMNVERRKDYYGHGTDPSLSTSQIANLKSKELVEFMNILTLELLVRNIYGLLVEIAVVVPTGVQLAMLQRSKDHKETYESFPIQVLLSHGDDNFDIKIVPDKEGKKPLRDGKLSIYK